LTFVDPHPAAGNVTSRTPLFRGLPFNLGGVTNELKPGDLEMLR
jgi:hypothetical protein